MVQVFDSIRDLIDYELKYFTIKGFELPLLGLKLMPESRTLIIRLNPCLLNEIENGNNIVNTASDRKIQEAINTMMIDLI